MRKSFTLTGMILVAALLGVLPAEAQTTAPRVFYTDLDSGRKTGGQNGKGVFVTVYGKFFGASQGSSTVTIGGGAVDNCPLWSDTRITCQLGSGPSTGAVVVTVGGRTSNNTVNFTVRSSGNIYFASPGGSDSNNGSFASPFKTILKCRDTMSAGDTCYLMDGFVANTNDGQGFHATMLLRSGGNQGAPIAFVAYPGATVTVGDPTGSNDQQYGIRGDGAGWTTISGGGGNFTVAGGGLISLGMRGHGGWRVIGLKVICPSCNGQEGALEGSALNDGNMSRIYGNEVTQIGTSLSSGTSKQYHAVYFTTDSNHIDFGWNHIHDNRTCRALQFHSSPITGNSGQDQYDLHVHDNLIHGDRCDGINFATVDPSKGTVEAYNNVIYNVGTGPGPPDGDANYSCIYSAGTTNTGAAGKGQVLVYNNTLYNCSARAVQLNDSGWGGAIGSYDSGAGLSIKATNNIIYATGGGAYLEQGSNATGDHNIFFGGGAAPSGFTNSINSDPLFASLGSFNFHLQSNSPAVDSGLNSGVATDFDGIPRPQGKAFDIGAFEFLNGVVVKPNPPTGLAGIFH
jgi:IPT/TIG domain